MTIKRTVLSTALASIALLASAAAALATPVAATTGVNVRSGPGTNFNVIDTLSRGENAEAVECVQSGWCRVEHNGPTGWVYNTFLGPRAGAGNQGGNAANPAQNPQVGACFYTEQGHGGDEYCSNPQTFNTLGGFDNRIRSYKVFGGAHVNFCVDTNMTGACYEGSRTTPTLGGPLDRQASSLSIFTVGNNQANNNAGGFGNQGNQNNNQGNQNQANQGNNNSNDPDCSFGLVLGPNGPTFSLTCGDNAQLPGQGNNGQANNNQGNNNAPDPAAGFPANVNVGQNLIPGGDQVCFYTEENYQGLGFCSGLNTFSELNATFNDTIRSIRVSGRGAAHMCVDTNLSGFCDTYIDSEPSLTLALSDQISSIRVERTNAGQGNNNAGQGQQQVPILTSSRRININSSYSIDVDDGNDSNRLAVDFKNDAVSPTVNYLTPRNGARFGSNIFTTAPNLYLACKNDDYTGRLQIKRGITPDSSRFCVRTSDGNYSLIRIVNWDANSVEIDHTTWDGS